MKTVFTKLLLSLLVLSFATSCVSPSHAPGITQTVGVPSPTLFLTPTATATSPVSITSTPTVPSTATMSQKCVKVTAQVDFQRDDLFLVIDHKYGGQIPSTLSAVNLREGGTTFVNQIYTSIATSPDLTKIAYIDASRNLIISDSTLKPIKRFRGTEHWWGVIDWADEYTVLINNMPLNSGGMINPPASTLLLDLQTGNETDYLPNYPEMLVYMGVVPNWGNDAFTMASYNNLFTRVAYLAYHSNGDVTSLILRDLQGQEELLQLYGEFDYGGGPQWFKDGSAFVVPAPVSFTNWRGKTYPNFNDSVPYKGGLDLALISSDGNIKRLTYLTRHYVAGEEGISLSPSNSKVAFWLNKNYEPGALTATRQLAILDIKSGEVTDLCLEGGDFPYPPVWSADEKYLLVTVNHTKSNQSTVMLVDIENQQASIVVERAIAVGWLTHK